MNAPRLLGGQCLAALITCAALALAVSPSQATTYPGFMNMVTDSNRIFTIPQAPMPQYMVQAVDPTFGTRVIKIAGNTGTALGGGVSGTWGSDARHHYSKDQPWNSNGTLLVLQNDASPSQVYLNGETYAVVRGKCSGYSSSDDRWHPSPSHPNERINVNGSELMWYDVVNCVKTRSWSLPFSVEYFGMGEGNPSNDGRFAALSDGTRMFVVDMDPQAPFAAYPASRIGPARDVIVDSGLSGASIDWVSISASGKYAVVSYNGDFPRVFDINPTTLALTPRPMPAASPRCTGTAANGFIYDLGHADLALNPFDNNEDVIVGQEHCGNRGSTVDGQLMGSVVMVRLRDGKVTSLTSPNNSESYAHHISTRNLDRPGWVYVGYHTDAGKFDDEIIAVKMDGSKAVQRFAHKHSEYSNYRAESHSVPSRDGRRVLFASNWAANCTTCGSASDIKAYVVDARGGSVPVADIVPPAPSRSLIAR